MDRYKQVSLRFVRDVRPLFQGNKSVIRSCIDNLGIRQFLLDQFSQPQRHVQAQVFLHQSRWPNRSRVVSAVSRVNHDAPNLQSQRPR